MKSFEKVTELSLEKNMYLVVYVPYMGNVFTVAQCRYRPSVCVLMRNTFCLILGVRTRTVDAYFCIRLSVCILLVRPFEDSKMTTSHRKFRKKYINCLWYDGGRTRCNL